MDKHAFAACMKRNREKNGITFENLAEKTGITIDKLIEFESGEFERIKASAVAVGTANFVQPDIAEKIALEMLQYMDRKGIKNVTEIVGKAFR